MQETTLLLMDPGSPSEQLSLFYNLPYDSSDAGRDYLAYQSRPEFLSNDLQSNGMDASSSTPTSYSQQPHQFEYDPGDGKLL